MTASPPGASGASESGASESGVSLSDEVVARLRAAGCVFAEDEAALLIEAATRPDTTGRNGGLDRSRLDSLVARRAAGEPLEPLLGWVAFAGERIALGPGVFVPRRRTEVMVDEAVRAALRAGRERAAPGPATDGAIGDLRVVELCCGVAAVGAVVALRLRATGLDVDLHVADIDPAAVEWARCNVAPNGHAYVGDLDEPLPPDLRGHVDLLLANAPYVPTSAIGLMPPEAREHEPTVSLDGGSDGLDVQRRVIADACAWLAPGGSLLIESSEVQAPTTEALMESAGLVARIVRDDEVDGTVVVGRRER